MFSIKRGDLFPTFDRFDHLESDHRLIHNHKLPYPSLGEYKSHVVRVFFFLPWYSNCSHAVIK